MGYKINSTKKIASQIASKIFIIRRSIGWSQSELARKSKVTSAAISQIEKGDRTPSLPVLRKLADALNVCITEFTGDSSCSVKGLKDKAQVFYRKFGAIEKLRESDQKIIECIIQRFKEESQ